MEEHEDWVAEVVIDVGDDIENHQQRPDQVVLDVVWNKSKNMLSERVAMTKVSIGDLPFAPTSSILDSPTFTILE